MIFENGKKVWVVMGSYSDATFFGDEDNARDELTRKDKLYSFVVTELKEEKTNG